MCHVYNFYSHLTSYNLIQYLRYFTGHTKDSNGYTQFQSGRTSFGDAIDDVIKIITIAVSAVPPFIHIFPFIVSFSIKKKKLSFSTL